MAIDTINKIRTALGDPQAPWYGSDVVAWVGDLIEDFEELEKKSIDCPNRPASKTEVEMAKRLCKYHDEVHKLKQRIAEFERQLDNARDILWGRKANYVKNLESLRDTVSLTCSPPDDCNDPIVLKTYMKGCFDEAERLYD